MNWRTVSRIRIWSLLSEKSMEKSVPAMLAQRAAKTKKQARLVV
jgi:hypothetical protein